MKRNIDKYRIVASNNYEYWEVEKYTNSKKEALQLFGVYNKDYSQVRLDEATYCKDWASYIYDKEIKVKGD